MKYYCYWNTSTGDNNSMSGKEKTKVVSCIGEMFFWFAKRVRKGQIASAYEGDGYTKLVCHTEGDDSGVYPVFDKLTKEDIARYNQLFL